MTPGRASAYDNTDQTSGTADKEVYLFDATTDRVTCVSCDPSGLRPSASASIPAPRIDATANLQRSVSNRGEVFFNTAAALVPEDVNSQLDIYGWEEGSVHLLSSGTSSSPSFFSDASASGEDAFFITREPLVSGDHDENNDLYDARVGGGFARADQVSKCVAEGCQGGQSAASQPAPPGSEAVEARSKPKSAGGRRKLQNAIKTCNRKHRGKARKNCIAKVHRRYGKNSNGGSK
jgi:hypothetical protein